jgi:hypothetical protein
MMQQGFAIFLLTWLLFLIQHERSRLNLLWILAADMQQSLIGLSAGCIHLWQVPAVVLPMHHRIMQWPA